MDEIREVVMRVVSDCSGVSEEEIGDDTHLVDDLGLDSIELVQLGLDLEEALDIEVPDSAIQTHLTVGGLVEAVRQIKQPTT